MPVTEHRESDSALELQAAGELKRPKPSPLNVPNIITLSRLVLSVYLFWLIDTGSHWLASFIIFAVAAATDAVDGYIARKYGLITVLGRILDPFVDKVIIGGTFLFLAVKPDSGINAWMVILVIGREMFVTSLRSFLESEGKDFSATWSGKIKMILQCAAVGGSLLFLEYGVGSSMERSLAIGRDVLLWAAIISTVHSGYVYVIRAIKLFRGE